MIYPKRRIALPGCIVMLIGLMFFIGGCSADDPTRPNTLVPLTSIEITASYASMAPQTVNQYRALGDFSGVFTRDITADVVWSAENRKIAVVSNEGLVTAVTPGETSITALYDDISASAPVIVTGAFLIDILISPLDAELQTGITQQYEASGTFSDDSVQDITMLATWETSDTEISTIDSNGLLTTLAMGTSTISATWQGITSSTTLLVSSATLTSISLLPENPAIAQGTTVQFASQGTFSDNSTLDITDIVDWQSSDTGIAIINAKGLAEGFAPGETEISALYDTDGEPISATAMLTVTSAVIESITVAPADSTIELGESQQFKATGTFSDGTDQDITDLATWRTTDTGVGAISNSLDDRGLFVSIDAGSTFIEATFDGVSGQTALTVE